MTFSRQLSAEQIQQFQRDGFLVIKGFYDLERDIVPIQRGIHQVIGQVLKRHGLQDIRGPFFSEHFDEGYQDLIKANRSYGAEVYDAVKQIPAFMRLLGISEHETLLAQLRDDAVPGIAAGGYGIRVDNPGEERFRAPWHQEYPAQLRSLDGLVYWSPLVQVTPELGPVRLCVGSHRDGPVPVYTRDPLNPDKTGAYGLILTNPGDLVIIDFLTLHASGHNAGLRSRWSMQFRYFNFNEPVGMHHGWKGSYAAGVDFATIHPELCLDK
jgi:Phytanoyl-CoA dioxygenase (PhyH)